MSREELLAALADEVRASQTRTDEIDEVAGAILGLNRTDMRVMDILDRRRQATAGHLAEEAGLTSGAMTAVLDRLERAGYVRRRHDTQDRRRVLVELTDRTRERSEPIWGPLAVAAEELFDAFTDAELEVVLRFMRAGRDMQLEQLERVRALREHARHSPEVAFLEATREYRDAARDYQRVWKQRTAALKRATSRD